MRPSRRSFAALLAGGLAAPFAGAQAACPHSAYPALGRLAALLPDRASCARLAAAGLSERFERTALMALDAQIAERLAANEAPADILLALNAADFRAGRTLSVGGFALARTEAAAVLLRARPELG